MLRNKYDENETLQTDISASFNDADFRRSVCRSHAGRRNGDGLVNLVDAIYALQVSAGIRDVPLT